MAKDDTLAQLAERLGKHQVMGEPYERGNVTVIPVSSVRSGGGFGRSFSGPGGAKESGTKGGNAGTGDGGGLGLVARPVGAWVINGDSVSWQPAVDVNRAILGGQVLGLVALLVLGRLLRRKTARAG